MNKLIVGLIFSILTTPAFARNSNPYIAEKAVYKIEIKNGSRLHIGTGVLIGRNKILTNCHVVRNKGTFSVVHKISGKRFKTTRYSNLGNLDACILEGNFPLGKPVKFSNGFKVGEPVWSFGFPHGRPVTTQGVVKGLMDVTSNGISIESSIWCKPGSSGGPLLNAKGELVGLNFAVPTNDKRSRRCWAVPGTLIKDRMQRSRR